jgi:hypothetical protein
MEVHQWYDNNERILMTVRWMATQGFSPQDIVDFCDHPEKHEKLYKRAFKAKDERLRKKFKRDNPLEISDPHNP